MRTENLTINNSKIEDYKQLFEQVRAEVCRVLLKAGIPIALVAMSLFNSGIASAQVETPPTSTVAPYTADVSHITKEKRILKLCMNYLTSPLVNPEDAIRLYEQCCILLSRKPTARKGTETTLVAPIETPTPPPQYPSSQY